MPDRRRRGRLAAMIGAVLIVAGLALSGGSVMAAGDFDEPVPPVTVNEFLPENRDLSDCISVLPKPGCGSESRGGWGQTAIFGALMLGLGVIGTRVVVSIRRRDAAMATATTAAEAARAEPRRPAEPVEPVEPVEPPD